MNNGTPRKNGTNKRLRQDAAFEEHYEDMLDEKMRARMARDERTYMAGNRAEDINRGKYTDLSAFESHGHRKISPAQMRRRRNRALLKKTFPVAAVGVLLIVGCLIYMLAIRPANQYQKAEENFQHSNYNAAASLFDNLGDYKDSEKYVTYINAIFASDRGEYESAAQMYGSLGDFLDSVAREEQARKNITGAASEQNYQRACSLLQNGDYESAKAAFSALGTYRDSEEKAKEAEQAQLQQQYEEAVHAEESGRLEKAKELFAALGDYRDSKQRLAAIQNNENQSSLEQKYQSAYQYYQWGSYSEAYAAFNALGSYRDSRQYAAYCHAMLLRANQEYESASSAFAECAGFLDSTEKGKECAYEQAKKYYRSGDYENAIRLFEQLGDYSDSQTQLASVRAEYDSQRYENALFAYYDGEREKALSLFEALGDYLDSRSWAERIRQEM